MELGDFDKSQRTKLHKILEVYCLSDILSDAFNKWVFRTYPFAED